MKKLLKGIFLICLSIVILPLDMLGEKCIYRDEEIKVYFTLDKNTHEAMVGIEEDTSSDHNALIYPEIGSLEWNTNFNSVWHTIVIPKQIVSDNEEYIVTSIVPKAFYKSTDIKQIHLPSTIRRIGSDAFGYCVNLLDFTYPEDLEYVGSNAFELCRNLTNANLPSKVRTIEGGAFRDCVGIKEVTIPKDCIEIGDEAFNWCTSVETVIIEDSSEPLNMGKCWSKGLTYEGTAGSCLRGMFGDAKHIKRFHWGRDLELQSHSNGRVLAPLSYTTNYYTATSGAQIPSTVSVDILTFGEDVSIIPRNAFAGGSIREKLVLPSNLQRIEEEAFKGTFLDKTSTLTIPSSLQYVGPYSLEGPNGLEPRILYFDSKEPPLTEWNETSRVGYPFWNLKMGNLLISVPDGAGNIYKSDDFWGKFTVIDPKDNIISINVKTAGSLYGRLLAQGIQVENIPRLQIQGTLNSEDWETIGLMSSLYELDLEASEVEEITNSQIPNTVSILKLPNSLKILGSNALCRYPITGTLEIPSSCGLIGSNALSNLLIDQLILPDNGLIVEDRAFAHNSALKEVAIGNINITGNEVFTNSGIEALTLKTGCNITGNATFGGCKNLKKVEVDGIIENIGSRTFDQWISDEYWEEYSITDFIINGQVKNSGGELFFNKNKFSINESYPIWNLYINNLQAYLSSSFEDVCSSPMNYAKEVYFKEGNITTIIFPEDVEEISSAIFRNCAFINEVNLPNNLKKIGTAAFEGCNIDKIIFPETLETISYHAFKGCLNLTEVSIPVSVKELNSGAFQDCSSLLNVNAFYKEPIQLSYLSSYQNDYPFSNVNSECCLHIPLGTAVKYRNANWNIPMIQESGCLTISIEGNGEVRYKENLISSGTACFWFQPYNPFEVSFEPLDGQKIRSVFINGVDNLQSIVNNTILFDDPSTDLDIRVVFDKDIIEVTSVALNVAQLSMTEGDTYDLIATVAPANATEKTVTWASSDESIATVDEYGEVIVVGVGKVTITVSCGEVFSECALKCYPKVGDANWNGSVTVSDAVDISNYVVKKKVIPEDWDKVEWMEFYTVGANANESEDGKITIADASAAISFALADTPQTMPQSRSAATQSNSDVTSGTLVIAAISKTEDGRLSVAVKLDDTHEYVALQADVIHPAGIEIEVKGGGRASKHSLETRRYNDSHFRLALYNLGNEAFAASEDPILEFVTDGSLKDVEELILSRILASDAAANEYVLDFMMETSTGVEEGAADDSIFIAKAADGIHVCNAAGKRIAICTLEGRIVKSFIAYDNYETIHLPAGIYIVKAADRTLKVIL